MIAGCKFFYRITQTIVSVTGSNGQRLIGAVTVKGAEAYNCQAVTDYVALRCERLK